MWLYVCALTSLVPVLTYVGAAQRFPSRGQPLRNLDVPHSGWRAVSRVKRLLDYGEQRGWGREHGCEQDATEAECKEWIGWAHPPLPQGLGH